VILLRGTGLLVRWHASTSKNVIASQRGNRFDSIVVNGDPPRLTADQAVRALRVRLDEISATGQEIIPVAPLRQFLTNVQEQPSQTPLDAPNVSIELLRHSLRAPWEAEMARADAVNASSRELFKSIIETAKVLIQSLILINGGSAVALLAFIGHLATSTTAKASISSFADPLLFFVIGTGTAALFAGFVCLGQKLYGEKWPRCANVAVGVSVLFALSSIAAFGVGSFFGYKVFSGL
jgi:hypothetical protein